MEFEAGSLQLLMDLGFMAGGYGYMQQAATIFDGLRVLRPENESPLIGLAFVILGIQPEESIRILEEALRLNPDSDLARGFMGIAFKLTGQMDRCKASCQEIITRNRDQVAVRMAGSLLEEIHST